MQPEARRLCCDMDQLNCHLPPCQSLFLCLLT